MRKKGSVFEQILYPIIGIVVVLLVVNFAFIGENAWFVKLGWISKDTANSLSQIYSFGQSDELAEETSEVPPNIKAYYNNLKANIKTYQKSYDRGCIITFDQKPLERQHSVVFLQNGKDVEIQLRKTREILREKEILPDIEVCTVAPPHYDSKVKNEFITWNRLDIESSATSDIPYVFYDGNLERLGDFIVNPLNKNMIYKVDDNHYCLFVFSSPARTLVPFVWRWMDQYNDWTFYDRFATEEAFFDESGKWFRPKCREKLLEYEFDTIYDLKNGKVLNLKTKYFTRKDLADDQPPAYQKDIEDYYNNTFFGGKTPIVPLSQVENMKDTDLKNKLRPIMQNYTESFAVNVDVFPKIEKKT